MIVVDTNVLAALTLGSAETAAARDVYAKDPDWCSPLLWRSEFCNILALHLRRGNLDLEDARRLILLAEALLSGGEHRVGTAAVLDLVAASSCTAYDCEFVALALELGVPLVTGDAQVLKEFPRTAISMREFA